MNAGEVNAHGWKRSYVSSDAIIRMIEASHTYHQNQSSFLVAGGNSFGGRTYQDVSS